jgi:hypothetical protein
VPASHLHIPPTQNQISSFSTIGGALTPCPAVQVPGEYGDDSINALYLPNSLNHVEATPEAGPLHSSPPPPAVQVPGEYGDNSINTLYLSDSLNHFEATQTGQGSTIPPQAPVFSVFSLSSKYAGHCWGRGISSTVPGEYVNDSIKASCLPDYSSLQLQVCGVTEHKLAPI